MTQTQWFPVAGVKLAAIEAGIKKANRKDLVVIELAEGGRAAGVFTTNRFQAAPVQVARRNLQQSAPRYLMINTGYANAGTGDKGFAYCEETCLLLSELAHCAPSEVLPFSTGVIGQTFPMKPFEEGLPRALESLDEHGWGRAAEGIMTTDTVPKVASRRVELDGKTVTITGMAKGAGMIKPNMATMLGFIATDAAVAQPLLDQWVKRLADASFNRITVDGDTSTNDACLLIASGRAEVAIDDGDSRPAALLYEALEAVFVELAQALIRDAEGASKFVSIEVAGARSDRDAQIVAETIGHSPLVKTALFASDPNWGRILAAVGRAPIDALEVEKVAVWLDDVQIVAEGGVADSYTEEQGARVMARPDITIRVDLGAGEGRGQVWTCDFSYDYVKINAEYRT
ncbi:bifunctional glutamate N-acetyltransferase/amino-acid acetyltransferase ArgJ [Alloalcanivorax marinus]|uniref:bifunctional glutamate N-acetyltransferase/amino-acid acetyltransferase ArgJ n=1 Tax=Alloalcanivorax marinus TaxID=1177169 RepID=UPI00195BD1A3|nr:bifunctional glutamate N-acetyltransferase/amino-acid acetyltransferase ArgJ [Alloalcanivorax marinus]MBM7332343.1 bifunctional glutamate N-acetyltransferase/amino-acid acetyltransferase ArgJ [Alloalcanivorax marinus]